MKKILIVGGAGYVGGVIVDLLLKNKNYEITVYDNLLYEESFRKNCKFIFGDVRDKLFFKKNCNNYDYIIWLAALVGDGACNINPKVTNVTNGAFLLIDGAIGTSDVLEFNTDYRTVTLNGVNRRALLNNSSTWFAAPPGTSYYTFLATGTDGNTSCVVSWRNAYI